MLLLADGELAARRAVAAGALAPLARSLAAELEPVRRAAPTPYAAKARMTRAGGRCGRDGALLAFDPFSPHVHHCPRCGAAYADEAHHRWWLAWHHLWLAERAVYAATLHALIGAPPLARFAAGTLDAWADCYLAYPNADNVLGPSRPFFSTYLESLWLLHLCVALDALERSDGPAVASLGARVRDRLVEPSRALVADHPEGRSNRQVWHAAALLAAARVLGDARAEEEAVHGPHGVVAALAGGVLADGTWYEGENYHQFAHRGLWYGVTLAEAAGHALPSTLRERFDAGFLAPFLTALPDDTLPARRDSQYAISLQQWRWAESCELGLARHDDARLAGALAGLYAADAPAGDTGRWRATGEAERNEPPRRLGRADLGWKSLLHARPTLPEAPGWAPDAVLLPAQGLAVLRGDGGRLYAALDYGSAGGGHGHPDRLNVLLSDGRTRWLDDPGTGSYVERTLHWYRSTLAHAAPLVDGRSQPRGDGALLGWSAPPAPGEPGGVAAAARIAPDVVAVRTLVQMDGYLVDRVAWWRDAGAPENAASAAVTLDLPLHVDGVLVAPDGAWLPWEVTGAGGLEDGFDFVEHAEALDAPMACARLAVRAPDGRTAQLWILAESGAALWRARAPGPPGSAARRFHAVRQRATGGTIDVVWDLRDTVRAVRRGGADGPIEVTRADGAVERHVGSGEGWTVARVQGAPVGATGSGATGGVRRLALPSSPDRARAALALVDRARPSADDGAPAARPSGDEEGAPDGALLDAMLGAAHYRRSEPTWEAAGRPTARVRVVAAADALHVEVDVRVHRPLTHVPGGAENPLDNERPEVNADGVQLHLAAPGGAGGGAPLAWLLVPEPEAPSVRAVATTPAAAALGALADASWARTAEGWRLAVALPSGWLVDPGAIDPAARTLRLDVLVNEMPPGRERRQGQLVLSGARGERVYLQGDRHDATRGVPLTLPAPVSADASR